VNESVHDLFERISGSDLRIAVKYRLGDLVDPVAGTEVFPFGA